MFTNKESRCKTASAFFVGFGLAKVVKTFGCIDESTETLDEFRYHMSRQARSLSHKLLDASLFESNCLAASLSQEVELGSANHRTTLDFDLFNPWRVKWELSLNPFTSNNASDHKHFACAGTALSDHDTTENLDTLFGTFLNLGVDVHSVADAKFIDFLLEGGLLNQLENLLAHDRIDKFKVNCCKVMVGGANMVTDSGQIGKSKNG